MDLSQKGSIIVLGLDANYIALICFTTQISLNESSDSLFLSVLGWEREHGKRKGTSFFISFRFPADQMNFPP